MISKVFIEPTKHIEIPVQDSNKNLQRRVSSTRVLCNQKVIPRKRNKKYFFEKIAPTLNSTTFPAFFKVKKSSIMLGIGLFLVFISSVPLTVNIKSYVWEKRRTLSDDGDLLYNLFLMEGIRATPYDGRSETADNFIVPSLKLKSYEVRKGDSLFSIAKKFGVSMDSIISTNNLMNAYYLKIGTTLQIPNISGIYYHVKRGDTLSSLSYRYKVDMYKVVDVNDLGSSVIYVGQRLFIPGGTLSEWEKAEALGTLFKYPATGRLTSRIGFRKDPFNGRRAYHAGIDLANRIGTVVYASQYGKVSYAGYKSNYGKTVIIVHPQGYKTLYAHLDKILVKKGQRVKQGEKIATVGDTGRSTGPHLHFEIHQYRKIIDPLKILRTR
jgi:murein DD-endopeptidase MepM/ murein hydrolase activator NlpD